MHDITHNFNVTVTVFMHLNIGAFVALLWPNMKLSSLQKWPYCLAALGAEGGGTIMTGVCFHD